VEIHTRTGGGEVTLYLEIDKHYHPKPWKYRSRTTRRFGWLWFAVGVWFEPYEKMIMEAHDFVTIGGKRYTSYAQLEQEPK
jgi:hypothetical protein